MSLSSPHIGDESSYEHQSSCIDGYQGCGLAERGGATSLAEEVGATSHGKHDLYERACYHHTSDGCQDPLRRAEDWGTASHFNDATQDFYGW